MRNVNGTVHPNHKGKAIQCPGCAKELTEKADAKTHLIQEFPKLAHHSCWLYYFYYCRECTYYTPQKANLQQHLTAKHDMGKADVSYAAYGGTDFILDEDGIPSLLRNSSLISLYGTADEITLTGGVDGGDTKYYPK